MSVSGFEAAVKLMDSHPDLMEFVGPRNPSLIDKAEKALGLRFPASYREFLMHFGAGSFGSSEVYGVIEDNFETSAVPDGIWYTLRKRAQRVLPTHLIVIYFIGDGGLYCLDTNQMTSEGECPVVAFYPGAPGTAQPKGAVAPDFGVFFQKLVSDELTMASGSQG